MSSFRRGAIALLPFVLAATGCAATGHGSAGTVPPPQVTATPTLTPQTQLTLPVYAYYPTQAQIDSITTAVGTLTDACMARFGLAFTLPTTDAPSFATADPNRYGLSDPALAAQFGYEPPPNGAPAPGGTPAPTSTPQSTLPAIAATVLHGDPQHPGKSPGSYAGQTIPAGGCLTEAMNKLNYSGFESAFGDIQNLGNTWYAQSKGDSRVVAAFKAWSTCMKAKGYTYPDPMAANDDPRWKAPAPPEEIATATADVACKQQTDVSGVWYAVEVAYENAQIAQNKSQLDNDHGIELATIDAAAKAHA